MKIGQLIQYVRKSKNLTQTELAEGIMISRPYLAKIENDRHQISSEKLSMILEFCNVNYDEFLFMLNDYKLSPKMAAYKDVFDTYQSDNKNELAISKTHIYQTYEECKDIFYKHLFILCECIELDFNKEKIPINHCKEIADYLISVENWCYYELVLFNNFLFVFPESTAMHLSKNLIKRSLMYKDLKSDNKILSSLLFNLIQLSINIEDFIHTDALLDTAKNVFNDRTNFFEQTMINFYLGIRMITSNNFNEGEQHCRNSLKVFEVLKQDEMYNRYSAQLNNALFRYSNPTKSI
ncbi:helix-turn-helix domain-containing protein [Paenibacillus amylolyticus]|uniref:helix-turn-helix domain-containing protein n=1 Tax=Paenibacillus amylolyticus TaxID=1451 RepID=UPI000B85B0F3|nr:Rgg/GadR/MutR family transcriptional regulator [Paenibacillus amylolyticus]